MFLDDNNNLLSVQNDYNDGDLTVPCVIIESDDSELVGNTINFQVEDVSQLIMNYLRSIFTN